MKLLHNKGFTLIEIVIVIAIIGILAAIAIPQFSEYRRQSYNTAAMSDLKNAATAQESYYTENKVYANSVNRLIQPLHLNKTPGVILEITGNENNYTIISRHPSGDKTYMLAGPGGEIKSN